MYFHHKDIPKVRRLVKISIFVLSLISYIFSSINESVYLFIYCFSFLPQLHYLSLNYHSGNRWERSAGLRVWGGGGGSRVHIFLKKIIKELVGVGHARAPVFLGSIKRKTGHCAPFPPVPATISASLFLLVKLIIEKNPSPWSV